MTEPKRPKFYNLVGHGGEVVPDMLCCEGCGYGVCSCPPVPPADVLPEGWWECPSGALEHVSKAYVYAPCPESWYWWTSADVAAEVTDAIHEPKPTREEAMAAALAGVPELRPGWEHDQLGWVNHAIGARAWSAPWGLHECTAGGRISIGNPTLEAAMQRAEALARGEP